MSSPSPDRIEALHKKLDAEAEASGYHLNPDDDFTHALIEGLLTNIDRYGYMACPCRLASGVKEEDLDVICPCDYRDPDLSEYGACYCALYVSSAIKNGQEDAQPIPERRPPEEERRQKKQASPAGGPIGQLSAPVHRCKVCGYLCARDEPPETCPICKAKKERFERFM